MEILLQDKEVAGLGKLPKGAVIECLSGQLWVTREGDNNDHILNIGNEYVVTEKGRIVVMGYSDARLKMKWPEETIFGGVMVPALQ